MSGWQKKSESNQTAKVVEADGPLDTFQIVKNPLQPAPVKWTQPSSTRIFKTFVEDIMQSVGYSTNFWDYAPRDADGQLPEGSVEAGKKAYEAAYNKYHDNVLRITKGMVPVQGEYDFQDSLGTRNYKAGVEEVAAQMPAILQNQIPSKDIRQVNDQEHADQFYNGILPADPSMRAQYPRWSRQRRAGLSEFHEDAAQSLKDYEALARDIIKTLPPEEWPQWVKNLAREWVWGPVKPVDWTPYPHTDAIDQGHSDLTLPESWGKTAEDVENAPTTTDQEWSPAATPQQGIPAKYTDNDPLDMDVVNDMVNDLHTEWWTEPPDIQRQAIANAFRAALTSPRQNLQWNSIVYQDMQSIPADETNPDTFENHIRGKKENWDRFGQQTIDLVQKHSDDPELLKHIQTGGVSKYMPGIWNNVRNAAVVGPYIEELRKAAIEDVAQGGTGVFFRQKLLELNIPGIGPKIAAFVWLLLCPKTSRLATIDVHMMRHLQQDAESPKDYDNYLALEKRLDAERKQMGYNDVPLGAYQWALWDKQRTPGYHQDHTPLRPLKPTHWSKIDWAPQKRVRKIKPQEVNEQQMQLAKSEWKPRKNYRLEKR